MGGGGARRTGQLWTNARVVRPAKAPEYLRISALLCARLFLRNLRISRISPARVRYRRSQSDGTPYRSPALRESAIADRRGQLDDENISRQPCTQITNVRFPRCAGPFSSLGQVD